MRPDELNSYRQFISLDGITYQERNEGVTWDGSVRFLGLIAMEGSGVSATPVSVDVDLFSVERPGGGGKGLAAILELLLLE